MLKVTICYGSSAIALKERIDEVNSVLSFVVKEWEFTPQQLVTNFTEKNNFFIRFTLLDDDYETASGLLGFALDVIKCMNRFILSSEVDFVCVC